MVCRATHEGVSWLLRLPVEALIVARRVGERLLAAGEAEAAALIDLTAYGERRAFRLIVSSQADRRSVTCAMCATWTGAFPTSDVRQVRQPSVALESVRVTVFRLHFRVRRAEVRQVRQPWAALRQAEVRQVSMLTWAT